MGVALGCIPGMPVSPGVEGGLGRVLYYTGAGALAVLGRNIYREWQKHQGRPPWEKSPPKEEVKDLPKNESE